jgi:hypothetical protein
LSRTNRSNPLLGWLQRIDRSCTKRQIAAAMPVSADPTTNLNPPSPNADGCD